MPLWWPLADGRCACGDGACPSPGKHPLGRLVRRGVKDATEQTEFAAALRTETREALGEEVAAGVPDGKLTVVSGEGGLSEAEAPPGAGRLVEVLK